MTNKVTAAGGQRHYRVAVIAGYGIANSIGQIWSGAMMLEHLGEAPTATAEITAMEKILASPGLREGDLGGSATIVECGTAVAEAVAG